MAHKRVTFEGVLTKTAPYTPAGGASLNVSAVPAEFTLFYNVAAMNDGAATLVIESSVDAFATVKVLHTEHFLGPVTSVPGVKRSKTHRHLQGNQIGSAGSVLRARLQDLTGADPSVTYETWIEYDNG